MGKGRVGVALQTRVLSSGGMPQSPWTALLCACAAIAAQWALTGQGGQALTRDLLPELDLSAVSSTLLAFGSSVGSALNGPRAGAPQPRQQKQASSAAPDIQPDEVRAQSAPLAKDSPAMRCFEALPPWSISSTHDVEIYVESHFVSGPADEEADEATECAARQTFPAPTHFFLSD